MRVVGASDDEALDQDLGGKPSPTKGWEHGVADVSAYCEQVVVQVVSNRCSPDQVVSDEGKQECGRHPRLGKVHCTSERVELLDVLRPRRLWPQGNGEVEVVGAESLLGRSHLFLVRQPKRS